MEIFHKNSQLPGSEEEILSCITRYFPNKHSAVTLGRGDDCALFHVEHSTAVSSDLFLENIHFRRSYFTPCEIGYKALAVNLSDLAACGARPIGFSLCLGLPDDIDMPWLNQFFLGMSQLADKYAISLIGGDLSRSDSIHISITVFGEISGVSCFLPRGGSMPGDILFVIGQLGLAHVGLELLERYGRSAMEKWPHACHAHLQPEPQCAAGLVLSRAAFNARPPALMDVSDGLIRDLPRLLGKSGELITSLNSGNLLGAELHLTESQLHPEVLAWSHEQHQNAVYTALLGGEDYALLGTCAPDLLPTLEAAIPEFQSIGIITKNDKISCNGLELQECEGFDHFSTPLFP
ncbi:MAG: thiamine-phosphate kinase [Desulfovibrio sp.]|nr:thiamine-phosphate kinase [Desulfovibrio sp.]